MSFMYVCQQGKAGGHSVFAALPALRSTTCKQRMTVKALGCARGQTAGKLNSKIKRKNKNKKPRLRPPGSILVVGGFRAHFQSEVKSACPNISSTYLAKFT